MPAPKTQETDSIEGFVSTSSGSSASISSQWSPNILRHRKTKKSSDGLKKRHVRAQNADIQLTIHKTPLTYTMTIQKTQLLNRLNLGAPSPSSGSVSSSDPLRVTRCSRQPRCPPWPRSKAAEPSPSNLRLSPGFSRESWLKDQKDVFSRKIVSHLSLLGGCVDLLCELHCLPISQKIHQDAAKKIQERNSSWNTFDQLTNTLVWTR